MGRYFDDAEAAASVCAEPSDVIRLLAERFMGQNPPAPFVYRTFDETGIQTDQKGRVLFDFGERFPDAPVGSAAWACGDLYCPADRGSRFVAACTSPFSVWLNGEKVFQSDGAGEREGTPRVFPVNLRAERNRFLLRCECTAIGFGATLQNAMPQWEPCCYVMPFSERGGAAGFVYTRPSDAEPGSSVWGDAEGLTGMRWLPDAPRADDTPGLYYAWTSFEDRGGEALPKGTVLLDGEKPGTVSPGRHTILLFGALPDLRAQLQTLPGKCAPVPVFGERGDMLVLGPVSGEAPDPSALLHIGAVFEDRAWRPDLAHTALRPYAEAPLFGRWTYPVGVTLYGLLCAGRDLGEREYIDYVRSHVRQVTHIQSYALWDKVRYGFPGVNQQLCWLDALDDCGSFGSLMLECDPTDPAAIAIAERIGTYVLEEQPRMPGGAYCRRDDTVWADDMYMSVPFLCRYAALTRNARALDEAARQQIKYRELLYLPEKKIMAHMRCNRHGRNNGIPWSRGNGWVIFSLTELLMRLPETHPDREALIRHFNDLTEGYLALQDADGLWHQILDEPGTYPETSAAAMFICAFSRGVRYGWYPKPLSDRAKMATERAWQGLTNQAVDRQGNLYGVCRGSGFSFSRAYYRTLSWNFNDTHGVGIVMLAGVEVLRMREDRKNLTE